MHLALPSIIQKFDLHLADPLAYSLTFNFTLTIKSIINIRAVPRKLKADDHHKNLDQPQGLNPRTESAELAATSHLFDRGCPSVTRLI
jgi:hypothetical protein